VLSFYLLKTLACISQVDGREHETVNAMNYLSMKTNEYLVAMIAAVADNKVSQVS